MKIKCLSVLMALGLLSAAAAGCGEKKESFDAAAYTQAFLDARIKGNTEEYAKLSGESPEDLAALFNEKVQSLVTLSIGENSNEPGSQLLPPQLSQDYAAMWEDVLQHTKYKAVEAKKDGDSYAVTIETEYMDLNTPVNDLLTEKLTKYYAESPDAQTNASETYLQLMLESYQEVLQEPAYEEPAKTTVTLSQDDKKVWIVSDEDLQTVQDGLFLPALYSDAEAEGEGASDPGSLSTEATPDQTYPEDLDQTPTHTLGESFILQQDGQDMVEFSVDKVEVTDERSEYDTSNPEKVVVVTYTYKNLGFADPILYDQMSFKLLEGESTCSPYYLQSLSPADIATKGGDSVTASLAYGVSADCKEVTVYVNNSQIESPFQVTVPLA